MTMGEKLQKLRNEKNMSQEKVAEIVGVSRQAVSKWENDLSYPDTKNLILLAEVFNVSVDQLLKLSSNNLQYLEDEAKVSKEMTTNKKAYYHEEIKTKLISYIILIAFIPLNVFFYNKGIYGEAFIEIGFLSKEFAKSLLYDIPFIIVMGGLLIKFVRDIKNIKDKEKTKVIITTKDKFISYITFSVVSLILIFIYFKFPPYTSLAVFVGMFGLVYISIFEVTMEITKKEMV